MNTTTSMPIPAPPFCALALAALIALGSMVVLHADTVSIKSTPSTSTNAVSRTEVISFSTNAPSTTALPALPAPSTVVIKKPANDDDEDDEKVPGDHALNIHIGGGHDDGHEGILEVLSSMIIPIVAILSTFGTPILIVFFVCYYKNRRRQDNLTLAREFLAKGMAVPPELLDPSQGSIYSSPGPAPSRCRSDLRKGFMWTFVGLGVTLALFVGDRHSTDWGWGLIPLIIGIGLLLSGWVEMRQMEKFDSTRSANYPPTSNPR